jgi:hypothetical protein
MGFSVFARNCRAWCYVFILLAVIFWRTPDLFLYPNFWAEEGKFYFSGMQGLPLPAAIRFYSVGNYQFLIDVLVLCALQVPLVYAPFVTTYGALAVLGLAAFLMARFTVSYAIDPFIGAALVAAFALAAPGYEIFASATNVQWVCAITILLLCLLPENTFGKWGWRGALTWTVICGTTGVPSCVLAPAMFVVAWSTRSTKHLAMGIILSFCTLFQLAVILLSPTERAFVFSPQITILSVFHQTILAPILGVSLTDAIGAVVRPGHPGAAAAAAAVAVISIAIATIVIRQAFKSGSEWVIMTLLSCLWIGVSSLQYFGARDDPAFGLSAWLQGRYFVTGLFCMLALLALASRGQEGFIARIGFAIILLQGVIQNDAMARTHGGKPWSETLQLCADKRPCEVPIWPDGWSVKLK